MLYVYIISHFSALVNRFSKKSTPQDAFWRSWLHPPFDPLLPLDIVEDQQTVDKNIEDHVRKGRKTHYGPGHDGRLVLLSEAAEEGIGKASLSAQHDEIENGEVEQKHGGEQN